MLQEEIAQPLLSSRTRDKVVGTKHFRKEANGGTRFSKTYAKIMSSTLKQNVMGYISRIKVWPSK